MSIELALNQKSGDTIGNSRAEELVTRDTMRLWANTGPGSLAAITLPPPQGVSAHVLNNEASAFVKFSQGFAFQFFSSLSNGFAF